MQIKMVVVSGISSLYQTLNVGSKFYLQDEYLFKVTLIQPKSDKGIRID